MYANSPGSSNSLFNIQELDSSSKVDSNLDESGFDVSIADPGSQQDLNSIKMDNDLDDSRLVTPEEKSLQRSFDVKSMPKLIADGNDSDRSIVSKDISCYLILRNSRS
jgi:hypothetical protein